MSRLTLTTTASCYRQPTSASSTTCSRPASTSCCRSTGASLATLAALAVPVAFSAYRLTRPRNYTQTREFRALAGGYLI